MGPTSAHPVLPRRAGTGRRAAAEWIAGRLGVPLLTVHAGLLAHDHTVDDELAVVFRAASLHGALLFIDEFEMFGDPTTTAAW